MFRITTDHFFKKRFPKLDFLNGMSVTMIANSKKMKLKKSHPPCDLCISSPVSVSPHRPCKKLSPLPSFLYILPSKKRIGVYSTKNLGNNI